MMWPISIFAVLAVSGLGVADGRPTKTSRDAVPWGGNFFEDFDLSAASSLTSMASSLLTSCSDYDLSQAQLPTAPTALPQPQGTLAHIAIGRGTQNYTCDLSNSTAVPVSIGAMATLYNVSCMAARSPSILTYLPNLAYSTRLRVLPEFLSEGSPSTSSSTFTNSLLQTVVSQFQASSPETFVMNMANALMSGHHFFIDNYTTPHFDLNTDNAQLGTMTASKISESNPPSDATESSVPWLYLTKDTAYTGTQDYSEVYRVNTVGGAAPLTCKDVKKSTFVREYAAEYWFYK